MTVDGRENGRRGREEKRGIVYIRGKRRRKWWFMSVKDVRRNGISAFSVSFRKL